MSRSLHVLSLEDAPFDAELIRVQLCSDGHQVHFVRVQNEDEFLGALRTDWDVILADYALPQINALKALQLLKESRKDIPFIVVTGAIGDEQAAECIKKGADDYLLKDRLARLDQAIDHAIEQKRLRLQKLEAELALRESEARYRLLAQNATDVIWTVSMDLRLTYISPSVERLRGYCIEECLSQTLEETLTPSSYDRAMQIWQEQIAAGFEERELLASGVVELELACRDGTTVWTETKLSLLRDPSGKPSGVLGVTRDISGRREAQEMLRRSEAHFRSLIENGSEIILVAEENGTVRYASPAARAVLGYPPDELTGKSLFDIVHPHDLRQVRQNFDDLLTITGRGTPFEARFRRQDGSSRTLETRGNNLIGDPTIGGIVLNSHDITERKEIEEKLTFLSMHDALTGLWNRAYFEAEIGRLQRGRAFPISVIVADLNQLKRINDSYGHAAGDKVLREIALVLSASLRGEDVLARIGGDEFAVLLPSVNEQVVQAVVDRVRGNLKEHNTSRSLPRLSVSLGAATGARGESLADVLKRADECMYADKLSRRREKD